MEANEIAKIEFICDACNFQKIQDWISDACNFAMITVDYRGTPLTEKSHFSEHCALVRTNKSLNDLCKKCDARGGLEAATLGELYTYRCHRGLVDFAMPITVNDQYVGTILAGQVKLADVKDNDRLEKIAESSHIPLSVEFQAKLDKHYELLPVMSIETLRVVADMIYKITKSIILDAQEEMARNFVPSDSGAFEITGAEKKIKQIKIPVCNSPILKPALDYIIQNCERKTSLDNMARLCNISPSYFSKLFNKCVGDNFNNYINIVRIEKACNQLTNTSLPVTIIALDLGFEDSSYFDKVFKHLTGMTPTYYRAINRTRSADTV